MEWRQVLPLNLSFGQKLCVMPRLSNGNHKVQSIQYCCGWVKIRVNWRPEQMLLVSNIAVGRLTLESIENPVRHNTDTEGRPSDSVFLRMWISVWVTDNLLSLSPKGMAGMGWVICGRPWRWLRYDRWEEIRNSVDVWFLNDLDCEPLKQSYIYFWPLFTVCGHFKPKMIIPSQTVPFKVIEKNIAKIRRKSEKNIICIAEICFFYFPIQLTILQPLKFILLPFAGVQTPRLGTTILTSTRSQSGQ